MIEKITLENFKGIGKETTIRLAPLTLLFGGNSSGKSTILHALAYVREIFESHACDVKGTTLGGDSIDLGGFKEIVHGHDTQKTIRMRFDFDNNGKKGWVQIVVGIPSEIGIPQGDHLPWVLSYQTGFDGKPFAELGYCPPTAENPEHKACLRKLDIDHPVIEENKEIIETFLAPSNLSDHCDEETPSGITNLVKNFAQRFTLPLPDALPLLMANPLFTSDAGGEAHVAASALNSFIQGPALELRRLLADMVYLGPIREIPARKFELSARIANLAREHCGKYVSRGAKGLGAYHMLPILEKEEWDRINADLSETDNQYLDTGYELVYLPDDCEVTKDGRLASLKSKYFPPQFIEYIKSLTPVKLQQFKQSFPKDKWFGLFDIKRKTLVQMYSVGLGLSQVIPLTVCMARHKNGTLLFEQPELHLHPKQQAAVGDLLIRAVKQSRSHIIAETHSVHLILRILRRIRETQNEENVIAEFTQDDLSVQYVDFESGRTTFTEMEVGNDGLFLTDWPDSFFEQEFMERFGL